MKKLVLTAAALALAASGAVAIDVDYGATLDTSTLLSSGVIDTTYYSQYKAAAWGRLFQATDKGGSLDLIGQASYRYTALRPYIFDLDLLRFTGLFPQALGTGTALELKVGRLNFSDATKLILDQTLDGVQVGLQFSGFQIRLAGAYSGLILNPSSNVRISADDWAEANDNSVFFGPKRLIAQAFLGSDIFAVQALAQFDMRGAGAEELINTQYLGIAGVPRLTPDLYLDYHLTGSYGQSTVNGSTTNLISALAGLGLRFYAEQLADSRAYVKVTYATGFTPVVLLLNNVSVDNFRPISEPTIGLAFSPQLANLLYLDLGYSLRPFSGNSSASLSNIEPLAGARVYFRDPVPLLVSGMPADILVNDLNPGSTALYLGTEITAGITARLLSDLGLSVVGGIFVPSAGGSSAFMSDRGIGYVLKVDISAAI
ncbi:MAG: hypothetical protein ACLQMF_08960 [Rectinemataceae bacterium]